MDEREFKPEMLPTSQSQLVRGAYPVRNSGILGISVTSQSPMQLAVFPTR